MLNAKVLQQVFPVNATADDLLKTLVQRMRIAESFRIQLDEWPFHLPKPFAMMEQSAAADRDVEETLKQAESYLWHTKGIPRS